MLKFTIVTFLSLCLLANQAEARGSGHHAYGVHHASKGGGTHHSLNYMLKSMFSNK